MKSKSLKSRSYKYPCVLSTTKLSWTKELRSKLVLVVEGMKDEVDWELVADKLGSSFSAIDCYIQFNNVDDPLINNGPWTQEEEILLTRLVAESGGFDWENIAYQIGM